MWCRHTAYSERCRRKRISIIRIIFSSWQYISFFFFPPGSVYFGASAESLKCFQCFSKVIALKCFAYRESGSGNTPWIEGRGDGAEARKLSNIEIKFISQHQKQLALVLRVCEIGDILKFFMASVSDECSFWIHNGELRRGGGKHIHHVTASINCIYGVPDSNRNNSSPMFYAVITNLVKCRQLFSSKKMYSNVQKSSIFLVLLFFCNNKSKRKVGNVNARQEIEQESCTVASSVNNESM